MTITPNPQHAATAHALIREYGFLRLEHYMDNDADALETVNMPSGWEILGSGCYRMAFLAPDGLVYKVETDIADYDTSVERPNESEFANFIRNADKIKEMTNGRARFAECEYVDELNVIVMEYCNGNSGDVMRSAYSLSDKWEAILGRVLDEEIVTDLHHNNLILDENDVVVIFDYTH